MTLFLCLLALFSSASAYNAPHTPLHTIEGQSVQYPATYEVARQRFRARAQQIKEKIRAAELGQYKVPHPEDKDLSTEHLWIPGKNNKKVLILTSGMHGPEGFTGHTLQMLFMGRLLESNKTPATSILIVHGLNPYGFKYFQRTNANNVDLNRNFAEKDIFASKNADYERLTPLLQPHHKASVSFLSRMGFYTQTIIARLRHGRKRILGSLTGQYLHPEGLYYGGQELQAETKSLQKLILKHTKTADSVLLIDLHTGFGKKSHLHFFGSEEPLSEAQSTLFEKLFENETVETAQDEDFYKTTGDMVDWFRALEPQKPFVGMTFEMGTMNSQTLLGGLKSLWIMVVNNQGRQKGFVSHEDQRLARQHLESLFNPQNTPWQEQALQQGLQSLVKIYDRFISESGTP